MFTLNGDGPSDFSLVISYADIQRGEKLKDFSGRLVAELRRALPEFQLRSMTERVLDGSEAVELAYSWRNDGHLMHQRQAIAFVGGTLPDSARAMLVAATCLKPFNEEWHGTFDNILASMKLRKSANGDGAHELASSDAAPAVAAEGYVFVLSERRRMLRAFVNSDEACRHTDPREVEQDAWTFFDESGARLYPKFIVPNTGTLWRKAGSYVLESRTELPSVGLRDCLHLAAIFQVGAEGGAPFQSVAEVRGFLEQQKVG
jgi:hypothetical protein